MNKRGQLQISFGVIFSILVIIFTIAIAFYVISYFLNLQKCSNLGLFYKDLESNVDKAWYGTESSEEYAASLPSGINQICFGNLSATPESSSLKIYEDLKKYRNFGVNVFAYPFQNSCKNVNSFYNLKHADTEKFFCVDVVNGKINILIKKDLGDALVHLTK